MPQPPEKQAAAKEKRLGDITSDIRGFTTGATPQPGLALEALGRVKGRGPKVQRAAESIQTGGAQKLPVSESGASAGTKALSDSFKAVDDFIKEELGDKLGEFTGKVQAGQESKTPEEAAVVQDQINRKLDEARLAYESTIRARFPGQPDVQQYYLDEFDRHAAEYGSGYTPPNVQPDPTQGQAPSEKQVQGFIAQASPAILDVIRQIEDVALESTDEELAKQGVSIRRGTGSPFVREQHTNEAVKASRLFLQLPRERQYQILAKRLLSGKLPDLKKPGGFPVPNRIKPRLQAPIPPPSLATERTFGR